MFFTGMLSACYRRAFCFGSSFSGAFCGPRRACSGFAASQARGPRRTPAPDIAFGGSVCGIVFRLTRRTMGRPRRWRWMPRRLATLGKNQITRFETL
ncbi:hypothetical protein DFH08DRAFT_831695 [Mycena albidolilacea]|uniref:Uncharacterized protein n=1 Tax=Mycena albidolilacea TaxID=1033008 RepID=A0AAD7F7A2_9AGAR|nr:hypothetical protein DFH08DRAFT_831695 [Mycena albidolilacea]